MDFGDIRKSAASVLEIKVFGEDKSLKTFELRLLVSLDPLSFFLNLILYIHFPKNRLPLLPDLHAAIGGADLYFFHPIILIKCLFDLWLKVSQPIVVANVNIPQMKMMPFTKYRILRIQLIKHFIQIVQSVIVATQYQSGYFTFEISHEVLHQRLNLDQAIELQIQGS